MGAARPIRLTIKHLASLGIKCPFVDSIVDQYIFLFNSVQGWIRGQTWSREMTFRDHPNFRRETQQRVVNAALHVPTSFQIVPTALHVLADETKPEEYRIIPCLAQPASSLEHFESRPAH